MRLRASLSRTAAIVTKESIEVRRDPITVWIAVLLPVLMMYLFSYAITLDVDDIPLAVVDEDGTVASREYAARFLHSGYFELAASLRDARAVDDLLDRGEVRVALVVPAGFARDLAKGLPSTVQVLLDGSFPNTALIARGYAAGINQAYELERQHRALRSRFGHPPRAEPAIRVEPRVRYNPGLRNANFIVPGLFAVVLMAFPPLLTALAVVRERERGSIQQLYTSPVRTGELFFGKLIPYAAIAFGEMLLLLAVAAAWFEVPVRGSVLLLLGFSALYVTASCGIGLVVSTWTKSQVVALLLAIVLTFMPAFLFSDFMFAVKSMPAAFQVYSDLFPARYFTEISRGIVLKGSGLASLWPNGLVLLGYVAALLILVSVRFRKRID